ncbi:unnamed protein product [Lactuca saligna]|uniref:protein disulfide-isomerase n=1 Tax=Lactuca saligna TaxID=75948 RepID=A0AA35VRI0_LACSI|nr:unnamed protein product [Lactuca saligna]
MENGCKGKKGFSPIQKCTASIRQLAYDMGADKWDEYFKMSERTVRDSVYKFCKAICLVYVQRYLRKPTINDIHQLYMVHEGKHGFPGMLGSIDCMHWSWSLCPNAWRAGANNDINVLDQSPVFNDIYLGKSHDVPFQANGVAYKREYYLTDSIYPPLSDFVKSFTCPNDPKRKKFKEAQESARKDVERAFDVLKRRWQVLTVGARRRKSDMPIQRNEVLPNVEGVAIGDLRKTQQILGIHVSFPHQITWQDDVYRFHWLKHVSPSTVSNIRRGFSTLRPQASSNLNLVDAFYGSSSPVLQLTPSNFKSKVVNSNSVVLVEFFAPWCGHCQALTPIWEKAASVLKGVATVAAIDADANPTIAQEYGIKGFPTIKVFVPGKPPVDYQGAREAKPIAEFALKQVKALLKDRLSGKTTTTESSEKKSEPNLSVELTSNNFDEMVVKSKDLWVVEFFAPWCGHCKKLAPEWKKAAKNLQGKVKLGHVNCDDEKSLMSRFKVQGFPTILVFGADKESPITYEGARTASAIESFALVQLETNVAPPEVTELTSSDVMEEKCGSAAICFVSFLPDILDSKAEGRNKYIEMLLSVAEKFKRSPYSYVWAAAGKQAELEKHVGVGGYGYPALVALNIKKGAYAPLRSAFEKDQIIEFVKMAGLGGKGNLPLEGTPVVVKTEPWDGKDGEIIEEDEFSLEELMGGGSDEKDEL